MAQLLSDLTSLEYKAAAAMVGRAAETYLARAIGDVPAVEGEERVSEDEMPSEISHCDYLIGTTDVLVGFEFTLTTPSRALSQGSPEAIESLTERMAKKFSQVYSTFRWFDPSKQRRWLPILVLVSPTVVDPLLNERVHERLRSIGAIDGDEESELMTCHAPEMLDLLAYVGASADGLVDAVVDWRDGETRGNALDWWLADRVAARSWSGTQAEDTAEWAMSLLGSD